MTKQQQQIPSQMERTSYLKKRKYTPPKVIYEGMLEIKAGSPLGYSPDLEFLDPASPLYIGSDR